MRRALAVAILPALVGCGDDLSYGLADPFRPQPDESEGLVNVSDDVDRLLEQGELSGACERYWAGDPDGRRARLLCGKEMFFYQSFDTAGAPAALIDHLVTSFPSPRH